MWPRIRIRLRGHDRPSRIQEGLGSSPHLGLFRLRTLGWRHAERAWACHESGSRSNSHDTMATRPGYFEPNLSRNVSQDAVSQPVRTSRRSWAGADPDSTCWDHRLKRSSRASAAWEEPQRHIPRKAQVSDSILQAYLANGDSSRRVSLSSLAGHGEWLRAKA